VINLDAIATARGSELRRFCYAGVISFLFISESQMHRSLPFALAGLLNHIIGADDGIFYHAQPYY